jgi:hypothetical protein
MRFASRAEARKSKLLVEFEDPSAGSTSRRSFWRFQATARTWAVRSSSSCAANWDHPAWHRLGCERGELSGSQGGQSAR